jgi:hypothetical protein
MAHDQEVVGSNPGTVYWMDVSNLLVTTLQKNWNGAHQKIYFKKNIYIM